MARKGKSISRRQFLKGAGVGLAAAGLAAVAPKATLTHAAPFLRAAAQAKSIRVLVVGDPFQFALQEVVKDFTDQTGITVNLESLAYDALQARLITSFVSKSPDADVITASTSTTAGLTHWTATLRQTRTPTSLISFPRCFTRSTPGAATWSHCLSPPMARV
jgi:ABC-type glycerol-3-phosphate transport system substrate-binding protein